MDPQGGRIYTPEQRKTIEEQASEDIATEAEKELRDRLIEMKVSPTPEQLARTPPKVGRNEPCPCGSEKKFKKCCSIAAPPPSADEPCLCNSGKTAGDCCFG